MSPKPSTLLLILFFSTTLLLNFPATVKPQDCPYPCFQPPTSGTGNNNNNNNHPTTTFTPPSTQTGSFQPPAFNPPPGGYLPNSPPYLGGGGGGGGQPRDSLVPTVPWFPYYRRPEESSSVSLWSRSKVVIAASCLLFLVGNLA